MPKELQRFAADARGAHEIGDRIVAARLNEILTKRPPGLRINAASPEPSLPLIDEAQRLRNALAGLRPYLRNMSDECYVCPWSLGHINGHENLPVYVGIVPGGPCP